MDCNQPKVGVGLIFKEKSFKAQLVANAEDYHYFFCTWKKRSIKCQVRKKIYIFFQ
jgi:hypothetical protein